MRFRTFLAVLLAALAVSSLRAHPVAQGSMDLVVNEDAVEIQAHVAAEQVFVSEAFAGDGTPVTGASPNVSSPGMWDRHGEYLLQHLQVSADGVPLRGQVLKTVPPESLSPLSRVGYTLRYPLPAEDARPGRIQLQQNVLNEIEFAPGNRWEATYIVQATLPGSGAQSGLLFTSREPLVLECDWSQSATGSPAQPVPLSKSRIFGDYLHEGAVHVLSGYDHLLFVAALVLAAATLWDVVKVVTAFTLAHTLTLTLSALNLVRLPSSIVEPMIAASIVFVALENVLWPKRGCGHLRLAVAFGFGLFHGLGFAGGLLEAMASLPGIAVFTAISAFSIGVELGHQAVVIPVFLGMLVVRKLCRDEALRESVTRRTLQFGSAAISLAGVFYFVNAVRG